MKNNLHFKTILFFSILICAVCYGQNDTSIKKDSVTSIKNINQMDILYDNQPPEDFLPDYETFYDLLIVKIGDELYMAQPKILKGLIRANKYMLSGAMPKIIDFGPRITYSYYKRGRPVFLNKNIELNIDPAKPDPAIFTKITHHKMVFDNEEEYQSELKKVKEANFVDFVERDYNPWGKVYFRCSFVNYPTNDFFLYLKVYVPVTYAEYENLNLKLKDYDLRTNYFTEEGKKSFENNIKNKTITYNGCEYYFDTFPDGKKDFSGYNAKNERLYLFPLKVYCHVTMEDCENRFDAKAMELFYGKPTDIFKEGEEKNKEYILEWYAW